MPAVLFDDKFHEDLIVTSKSVSPEETLQAGKAALAQQDYVTARALLQPLAEKPDLSKAKFFLARTEFEDGNFETAWKLLHDFLQKNPEHPGGWVLQARLHVAENDLDAAYKAVSRALECRPDFAQALKMQAEISAARTAAIAEPAIAVIDQGYLKARDKGPDVALREAAATLAGLTPGPNWDKDPLHAKIAYFRHSRDIDAALRNYDAHLIEVSCEFDYIAWPKRIQDLVMNRSILDVGCGFGGYGMGFLVAGAVAYVGLDPKMDLDSTRVKNKRVRRHSDMGVTPRAIAEAIPAIRLFQATAEDLSLDEKFDTISLHNVTEHLLQLDLVFEGLIPLCKPETKIVFVHHNFYCWNGHHFAPNKPHQLDLENPKHAKIYDWRHIEIVADLPDDHYFKTHLNRVTLDEVHAITQKHFEIERWEERPSDKATLARLSPEVIARVQKTRPELTERDLATNVVFCVARPK